MDHISDKVSRALAAAEEAQRARDAQRAQRADRAYLVRDAADRYGLSDALAARITADGPTAIQDEARRLAV
ncbi:hypothetical protein [Micromonospora sediminicola]|nr:hypothetical protein [Micromonospora sediminicola]